MSSAASRLRGVGACAVTAGLLAALAGASSAKSADSTRTPDRRVSIHGDLHVGEKPVRIDIDDDPDADVERHIERNTVEFGPHITIDTDESVVRMFSDVLVDSSEHIDDGVVALFGTVTVRGSVAGDVVAVMGSVRVEPGASVGGDVVAIGGSLDQAPGAIIHGERVSLSFLPLMPGVPPLRALFLMLLVLWVVAMLGGALVALLLPRRFARVADTISERTGWSLLLGFMLPPLTVIAAVLLVITLIGIPLAFLLPLLYLMVLWFGAVAATHLLGSRLLGRIPGDGHPFPPILLGTAIVAAMFGVGAVFAGPAGAARTLALFPPLLGLLLATALAVLGSGAVVVSMFGPRGGEVAATAPAAAAPTAQPIAPTAG